MELGVNSICRLNFFCLQSRCFLKCIGKTQACPTLAKKILALGELAQILLNLNGCIDVDLSMTKNLGLLGKARNVLLRAVVYCLIR